MAVMFEGSFNYSLLLVFAQAAEIINVSLSVWWVLYEKKKNLNASKAVFKPEIKQIISFLK